MALERMSLNLDRTNLDEAMKKAVAEGIDLKTAGNQSAFIRWLIDEYLKEEKE